MNKQQTGFTLLEVLIALAILAISSLAVISQTGQSLTQLERLHLKTTAMVVADNQLALLQAAPDWPAVGSQTKSVKLGEQQWQVSTDISQTSDPWLRKIEVIVSPVQQADNVLALLVGYRGKH
ncbi:type II secretion system protein GspI [Oceanicoccus sagamiensis]|uniref:Type II secretion system protein I n=1 Tax=Oceanicoccus sagamiensis TaxID=716816 RepID=A0A1X9NRQ7_9GAMM|nr:type II secretion system protein GspI [Oceanicoccus sagamiensis]